MVIRSEFLGVKAGDHVYGILREFLYIYIYYRHCTIQYSDTNTHGSVSTLFHQGYLGPPNGFSESVQLTLVDLPWRSRDAR